MGSPADALEGGRFAYDRSDWADAFAWLTAADEAQPLGPDDLLLLGRSAYMLGNDDVYVAALERAHHAYLAHGRVAAAVRCTWWIGHSHLFHGRRARAEGWFAVGSRLLDGTSEDCVERGYVLIPVWLRQMGSGDSASGYETALTAAAIGERFGDADLIWLARDDQSRALVKLGRPEEAMRLVNELLVVVDSGALSPIVTGIVYCNTIDFCQEACEVRHAQEWTEALSRWCADRPQMVAHLGFCLVHRAELMQLRGQLTDALGEARRAAEAYSRGALNEIALGKAFYRQGEVHRLQARPKLAEECYQEASRRGCEPLPGLALHRLGQGDVQAAAALMRRAMAERVDPIQRAALLPAYVEVVLADGDLDAALAASVQLVELLDHWDTETLRAAAELARGRVAQAAGDHVTALRSGRLAWQLWHDLDLELEAARARVLVATACRSVGDQESARLEAQAAREVFIRVGAVRELATADELLGDVKPGVSLSARELEVLRLVALGHSNRDIAQSLTISEHTVARHLQNIYAKIDVSSRAAATAFAFTHELL